MCWNEKISIGTFIFALSTTFLLWYLDSHPITYLWFLLAFSSMQLVEGLFWRGSVSARVASGLVIVVLFLQLVLLMYHLKPAFWKIGIVLSLIWLIVSLVYTNGKRVVVAENGHLDWPVIHIPFLVLVWTLLYFYPPVQQRNWKFVLFNTVLYSVSFYMFWSSSTFGSMWCWVSNMCYLIIIVQVLFISPIRCLR